MQDTVIVGAGGVAAGKREKLSIFGSDYDTCDGTGARDYIHVVDLARAHLKALEKIINTTGIEPYNIGTGVCYSVLDLVNNFEKATNQKISYVISERRLGDIDKCYEEPTKAKEVLNWFPEKSIEDMCRDAWRFQVNNPNGYEME